MYHPKIVWRNQAGLTLVELIVLIVLLGGLLPAVFSMMHELSHKSVRNEIIVTAVSLASTKMEEILAYKREHPDSWTAGIGDYSGSESLSGGYSRNVTVTQLPSWGGYGIDVYRVETRISHHLLGTDYTVSLILAPYQE